VDRAAVCRLGDPGSDLGRAKFLQSRPTHYSILCTGDKTGRGDSQLDKGVEFDP
jgi:hypothetical protein